MKAQLARASRRSTTMKKTGFAFALLAILLAICDRLHAQTPAPKPVPVTPAPDLSKLNIEQILQRLQTTKVPPSAEETSRLQPVAEFLHLPTGQASELEQLLQARQATLAPLFQAAQSLIQQLGMLLASGGNPAQVGALEIQIHALHQRMAQAHHAILAQFMAILDPYQPQTLHAAQI